MASVSGTWYLMYFTDVCVGCIYCIAFMYFTPVLYVCIVWTRTDWLFIFWEKRAVVSISVNYE